MRLILVRHGIADTPGQRVVSDADRALTPRGRKRTEAAARGLRVLGCAPDRIVTSPLRRAVETAEIIAAVLDPPPSVMTADPWAPDTPLPSVLSWLKTVEESEMLIVGHMPSLGALTSILVAGHDNADIRFKKAAACCLTLRRKPAPGGARLEWLIQPAALRRLGG